MGLIVAGLSHRTAPIEIREKCAFGPRDTGPALDALRDASGMREGVLVSTCNRTEFYLIEGALDGPPAVWEMLSARLGTDAAPLGYVRRDRDAVRHLMRVTSGLDSMVVGEAQIKGQVRDAWELCRPYSGPVLNRLFQTAQSVAGRVRTETAIGRGAASVSSAAVQLAKQIFGSLHGGCEMQRRDPRSEHAIGFLRKRLRQIAGTQARLHMGHRHATIKRCECSAKRGGSVTLDDHKVGIHLGEHRLQRRQNTRRRFQ